MFDDRVVSLKDNQVQKTSDFEADTTFADINLWNNFVKVVKKSTGIFSSESNVEIGNVNNDKESLYKVEGIPKSIVTRENTIAINLGTEAHFIRYKWMAN